VAEHQRLNINPSHFKAITAPQISPNTRQGQHHFPAAIRLRISHKAKEMVFNPNPNPGTGLRQKQSKPKAKSKKTGGWPS
jgi:hypothetical protein